MIPNNSEENNNDHQVGSQDLQTIIAKQNKLEETQNPIENNGSETLYSNNLEGYFPKKEAIQVSNNHIQIIVPDKNNKFENLSIRLLLASVIGTAVALYLLFTVDLKIVNDTPGLWQFWWVMVYVIIFNVIFFILEFFSTIGFVDAPVTIEDRVILVLASMRNVLLVLNCLPVVQLLGLAIDIPFVPMIIIADSYLIVHKYYWIMQWKKDQLEKNI